MENEDFTNFTYVVQLFENSSHLAMHEECNDSYIGSRRKGSDLNKRI